MSTRLAIRAARSLNGQLPSRVAGPSNSLRAYPTSIFSTASTSILSYAPQVFYSSQASSLTDVMTNPPGATTVLDRLSPVSSVADQSTKVVANQKEALALLSAQPFHYVVASIVGRTMLLHERDLLSLPRIRDVQVGDVLELDRIHEVGSRDYTLRAQDSANTRSKGSATLLKRSVPVSNVPETVVSLGTSLVLPESQSWAARLRPGGLAHKGATLSKDIVRVRCTVVEHTKGPMEMIVKKKRRKGYRRTIRHKQTYTRLRVEAVQIGDGFRMTS